MKIAIIDSKTMGNDLDLSIFKDLGELDIYDLIEKKDIVSKLQNYDVIITNKVKFDAETIKSLPKLKLICLTATGTDNIDLTAAKECNITVKNVVDYSSNSVAQHTFALLLSLMEQLRYFDDFSKSKDGWSSSKFFTNLDKKYSEISGKNWGIIGLGNIGNKVANIAEAFGANVLVCSPSGSKYETKYKQVSKDELMSSCDIITIHTPLNKHSENFITRRELEMMKDGSYIVNVARGKIINEQDMAKVLDEKNIYHATDVLAQEPMQKDHVYLNVKDKSKLIITPHIAWASSEARKLLMKKVHQNIKDYIEQ